MVLSVLDSYIVSGPRFDALDRISLYSFLLQQTNSYYSRWISLSQLPLCLQCLVDCEDLPLSHPPFTSNLIDQNIAHQKNTIILASFPGLSHFYVRLVHAKHECEEKFEKQERPGTISHVR